MHDNGIDNNPSNDALSKSEKAREIKHQYQKKRNKKRYAAKFREVYKKKHGKLPQGIKEKLLYRLKENMFVKSATFNGKPVDKTISHADIMSGGELVFEMGR